MKKFLLLLFIIFAFGCERKENYFELQKFLEDFKKERGIETEISIKSIYSNNDFEFVAAKKDFDLFLYKIKDKKIITKEKIAIPKQVTKTENGEIKSYPVEDFFPVINRSEKSDFIWVDVQRHFSEKTQRESNPFFIIFSFVVSGNSFVKIDNSQHKWNGDILNIRTWNDNYFLVEVTGNQSNRDFYIYDNQWKFLFASPIKSLWNDKKFYPITSEEAIEFLNEKQLFQKINIKNNQINWAIGSSKIFGSKEVLNAKITHLEKQNNIWIFTFNYELLYTENDTERTEKGTKKVKINIENGTILE